MGTAEVDDGEACEGVSPSRSPVTHNSPPRRVRSESGLRSLLRDAVCCCPLTLSLAVVPASAPPVC